MAESYDQNLELVAPTLDTKSVFSVPMLLQLFPQSRARSVLDACKALESSIGRQQEKEAALEGCSASSSRLFAQVRGTDKAFSSIRFKLNSAVGQEVRDLPELSRVVAEFHERIGWLQPQAVLDQVIAGVSWSCRSDTLEYQFAPERGQIPRFNLTIRVSSEPFQGSDQFTKSLTACIFDDG